MVKKLLQFVLDYLVVPVMNLVMGKWGKQVDYSVEVLTELIDVLTALRDGISDKQLTDEELAKIDSNVRDLLKQLGCKNI
jgi:hypothetical protein